MTFEDVCAIALAWPAVERGTSYRTPALKVKGKLLTRLKEDGESLVVFGAEFDERDMLIETQPDVFHFTDHYRDYPIVLLRLSKVHQKTVEAMLFRRWQAIAPKAVLAAFTKS